MYRRHGEGHSPALAGREMLAEETLIVSLSGFARHTQAPIVTLSSTPLR